MQVANPLVVDGGSVLSRQAYPVKNCVWFEMLDTPGCPPAVPFDQHRQGIQDDQAICSQRFKERPFIGAEGVSACCAIVPSLDIAVDVDVPYTDLAKIKTGFMVAPWSFWIHCTSPRLARCANNIPVRLSRLNGTAPWFDVE
jgi:hypothetical protein